MRVAMLTALTLFGCLLAADRAWAADGGLRLTGRALVAAPQKDFTVFLTWRRLDQDGPDAAFEVYRSDRPDGGFAKAGTVAETTTFADSPGKGTFYYHVMPTAGALQGARSNTCCATTEEKGRDWVEIMPAARGKRLQFSDRHFAQGGTYGAWQMWAYDCSGAGFTERWHIDSAAGDFRGNRSSSHTILVVDLDGDGRDEINNGATVLRPDGTVLWTANGDFGPNAHVDGQVIDDIDPDHPGLELMTFAEKGDLYALYDARTGKRLWVKHAPAAHLQCNIAANVTGGKGLDILGVFGGHLSKGGFACSSDGTDVKYPYPDRPMNGDRWWPMDWDGGRGRNVCMNFLRVYGTGGKVLYEVDLSDAPKGDVIPWNEHHLYNLWFNVDIVGDYREDIPVQMPDGSVRVYINTKTPPGRKPCKWQDRAYQMLQAPGDYRYFIRTLYEPQGPLAARKER